MKSALVIVLLAVIGTCYPARLDSTYLPPSSAGSAGGAGFIQPPSSGHGGSGPVKYSGPVGFDAPGDSGGLSGPSGFGGPSGHGSSGFGFGGGGSAYTSTGFDGGYSGHGGQGEHGGQRGHGQEIPIISYSNENGGDGNYQYNYETGNGITVQETGHKQGESESVSGSFSYTGPDGMQYSITYTADEHGFHPQGAHLPTPPPIPPEIQRGVELALAAEAKGENQGGEDGGYLHAGGNGYLNGGGGYSNHRSNSYQGPNSYQTSSSGGYQY